MPEKKQETPNIQKRKIDLTKTKIDLRYRSDHGCGKTAMCARFFTLAPPRYMDSTIATEYFEIQLKTESSSPAKLMVWDTPGNSLQSNAQINHCSRMSVVVICYDPSVRESYLHVEKWLQEIRSHNNSDAVIVLAAVKKDLIDSGEIQSTVPVEEAQEFANARGMRFCQLNATNLKDVCTCLRPFVDELHESKFGWAGAIQWDGLAKKNKKQIKDLEKVSPKGCLCFGR